MKTKSIVALCATLLLLSACISEPLVSGEGGSYGDGKPTPVTLAIRGDRFTAGEAASAPVGGETAQPVGRALPEADEAKISYLNLLVFDADGKVVLNESFDNLTLQDETYRLQIETLPGSGMQFYVLANADVANLFSENLVNALKAVTKLDDLKALLTSLKADNNGLDRSGRLLMAGNATVNVTKPYRDAIPLTLTFLSAKVTVKFIDQTPDELGITIKNWDIVNAPRKSYLVNREKEDAVSKTKAEDYLTTASKFAFENSAEKEWSQTFYLLENRQGGRIDRSDPTNAADKYPGMKVDDNDQRGKAWYAPTYATYLLAYGTHTKDGNTNDIFYKIYLGENAVNDYSLCRGKHYRYNVTIKGLNNIDVDTNVDWGDASFTVDKSDNLELDAHPDFRVLRIGGTAVDALTPAYATVEVLDATGQIACDWLKVSPLNLYRHSVKQAGNAGEHQQFGATDGVGSFVRTRYTPTPTTIAEFKDATFAMTRKLTKIPFGQVAVCTYQDIVIYADALDTPDATRTAKVRVTYYKGDEQRGQQTYDISQTGPIRVSDDLFVERYEEAAMTLQPDGAAGVQQTSVMQWGYNSATLYSADDRFSNGGYLTANAVYNTVGQRNDMDAPQWTATANAAYREKYPYTGAVVTEPTSLATTQEGYYYPVLVMSSSYFHPVFNSSAARYCHEKNRDTDGDGIISQSETFWYLPSFADMYKIKNNMPDGLNLSGTYWTSTEDGNTKSWAFTFPAKTMEAADKTITNRVRCVRGKGAVLPSATIKSTEEDDSQLTLSAGAKTSGVFKVTNDSGLGLTWKVTSSAPAWLKVATDDKGTDAADSKTGTGDATFYAYAVTAHTGTSQRSATLTLTRAGMTTTPKKQVEVKQEYFLAIKGGNSNCYMLPPGNNVTIPVERANESFVELAGSSYNESTKTYYQLYPSTSWTACLVWESSVGLVSLSDKTGTGPLGGFKVTATNAATQGNAVVAIKNAKNEILWSWHIWVTTYDGSTRFSNNNGNRTVVFMDRALGATSATPGELSSCGLLYQWGRKDPFPGVGQEGGSWIMTDMTDPIRVYNGSGGAYEITKAPVPTIVPNNLTNAIRNPDTFYYRINDPGDWFVYDSSLPQNDNLWSGGNIALSTAAAKSVFDPCPTGWRTPPWLNNISPFAGMENGWSWGNYGQNWSGTGGYFSVSGTRLPGTGMISNVGKYCSYWSGASYGTGCYYIRLHAKGAEPTYFDVRSHAFPVRCCQDNL